MHPIDDISDVIPDFVHATEEETEKVTVEIGVG
jgi:hypothetical protein